MTILVLLATMACNRSNNTGDTDGFGTTDDFSTDTDNGTGTAGPMTATEAMSSTMTAGMTAGMTDAATQGDDMMGTTGAADSTGGPSSTCIASGQYTASLVGLDDPSGHLSFLQLFYSANAPAEPVDEIFVVDVAEDGTLTLDILPRDSDGSGHSGVSGLEGTLGPDCEIEIVSQAGWDSTQGSFGTIDIELSGTFTVYEPVQVPPSGDLTFSGGSIPNRPITFSIELAGE